MCVCGCYETNVAMGTGKYQFLICRFLILTPLLSSFHILHLTSSPPGLFSSFFLSFLAQFSALHLTHTPLTFTHRHLLYCSLPPALTVSSLLVHGIPHLFIKKKGKKERTNSSLVRRSFAYPASVRWMTTVFWPKDCSSGRERINSSEQFTGSSSYYYGLFQPPAPPAAALSGYLLNKLPTEAKKKKKIQGK